MKINKKVILITWEEDSEIDKTKITISKRNITPLHALGVIGLAHRMLEDQFLKGARDNHAKD